MNDEKKEKYAKEVDEIINSRYEFIDRHYLSIRDKYQSTYGWPEFDILRHEICLCIMFGLCQSAITLTNHMLESLLKNSLIILKSRDVEQTEEEIRGKAISSLEEKFSEGIKKYGNIGLNDSINIARKLKLISKEQKKDLHAYRENFRNAFSHADKAKTFGDSTMPVSAFKLDEKEFVQDESRDVNIANFMIGQSFVQLKISQEQAAPYFRYIDNLVRELYKKLFEDSK